MPNMNSPPYKTINSTMSFLHLKGMISSLRIPVSSDFLNFWFFVLSLFFVGGYSIHIGGLITTLGYCYLQNFYFRVPDITCEAKVNCASFKILKIF